MIYDAKMHNRPYKQKQYKQQIEMQEKEQKVLMLPHIDTRTNIKALLQSIKHKRTELQEKITKNTEYDQFLMNQSSTTRNDLDTLREKLMSDVVYHRMETELYQKKNFRINESKISRKTKTEESDKMTSKKVSERQILPKTRQMNEIREIKVSNFEEIFHKIPEKIKKRNSQSLAEIKEYLINNNPFFMKVNYVTTSCLIKLAKFVQFKKSETIYTPEGKINSFFIILQGKVKLVNPQFNIKRNYSKGQTFAQELLFSDVYHKKPFEIAKAVTHCYVMEIEIANYQKISLEMMKLGFRVQFFQLESLLKRSYFSKSCLRSYQRKISTKK